MGRYVLGDAQLGLFLIKIYAVRGVVGRMVQRANLGCFCHD